MPREGRTKKRRSLPVESPVVIAKPSTPVEVISRSSLLANERNVEKRTLRARKRVNYAELDDSGVSQYNDNVLEPTTPLPVASQRRQTKIQPTRALTCAELREEMKSDTSEEERFREAIKKIEDYELDRSASTDLPSSTQKDSADSESSPLDSESEPRVEKSLTWDSKGIDLTSQGSIHQVSSPESSEETDSLTEKSSLRTDLTEYRHVWIPEEEVDDSPVLHWTRVRPSSLSAAYRKKLDSEESQRHQKKENPERPKVMFRIPSKTRGRPLEGYEDYPDDWVN